MGSGLDTSEKRDEEVLSLPVINCHSVSQKILKLFLREGSSEISLEPSPREGEYAGEVSTRNFQKVVGEINEYLKGREVDEIL